MILLLGGTSEARSLAEHLVDADAVFTSSLAGRVARPRLPAGPVRIGGFGGVDGLRDYLRAEGVTAVVDATHPFAEGMTANAAAACVSEGIRLLRLERPGWAGAPGADSWYWVDSHSRAAELAAQISGRPFLTVGRQALDQFIEPLREHAALLRVVDTPEVALPPTWTLKLSRGPYSRQTEQALMTEHDIDAVITKDSGGDYTWAKMAVAAERGAHIIVVRRTPGPAGIRRTHDVATAATWAHTP